jgi:hypothetical protein
LDNPQKLRKLRVEALIFTGGMNKNYIGYSLQVEEVGGFSRERCIKIILDNPQKLRKLRVEAIIFVGGMNKKYIG